MKRYTLAVVIFAHFLFLALLVLITPQENKKVPPKMIVTTFVEESLPVTIFDEIEAEELPIAIEESTPIPTPLPEIEEKPIDAPKKEISKVQKPKKKAPAPTTAKPKKPSKIKKKSVAKSQAQAPKKNEKLLSLMKESLAHLEKEEKQIVGERISTKKIVQLQSEGKGCEETLSYEEELAIYLKHKLQLPDPGLVSMKLTLSSSGKVLGITIIKSSSEKNKGLVEQKLPKIRFPSFDERLKGEAKHTFSIVLKT